MAADDAACITAVPDQTLRGLRRRWAASSASMCGNSAVPPAPLLRNHTVSVTNLTNGGCQRLIDHGRGSTSCVIGSCRAQVGVLQGGVGLIRTDRPPAKMVRLTVLKVGTESAMVAAPDGQAHATFHGGGEAGEWILRIGRRTPPGTSALLR